MVERGLYNRETVGKGAKDFLDKPLKGGQQGRKEGLHCLFFNYFAPTNGKGLASEKIVA